jgi:hypothetical protein
VPKNLESLNLGAQSVGVPIADCENMDSCDFILQSNGNLISPLSASGIENSCHSEHIRSMILGYNPKHYGYCQPIPIGNFFAVGTECGKSSHPHCHLK